MCSTPSTASSSNIDQTFQSITPSLDVTTFGNAENESFDLQPLPEFNPDDSYEGENIEIDDENTDDEDTRDVKDHNPDIFKNFKYYGDDYFSLDGNKKKIPIMKKEN